MAQQFATGPVDIFVGIGQSFAPLHLGHGKRAPRISNRRDFPVRQTDLSGTKPHDLQYGGCDCIVTVTLSRFNQGVFRMLKAGGGISLATILAAGEGVDPFGAIGSLMLAEGKAVPFWYVYPFSAKTAYLLASPPTISGTFNGLVDCEHYFAGVMIDDTVEAGTTDAYEPVCSFWHIGVYQAFGPLAGGFALYDHTLPVGVTRGSIPPD